MLNNTKNVIVTGGSTGIGRGIVQILSEYHYTVYFTYKTHLNEAIQIQKLHPSAIPIYYDLEHPELLDQFNDIPNIDILINNAGMSKDNRFINMTYQDWNTIISTNLICLYHLTNLSIKKMINSKWGRIINISSIAAQKGSIGKTNYSAAKAGMIGFAKSLSLQLADYNITVNTICPGAFDTEMFRSIPQKYRNIINNEIPIKRIGEPCEIGQLVKFLCSDDASYITGQTININGGWYFG